MKKPIKQSFNITFENNIKNCSHFKNVLKEITKNPQCEVRLVSKNKKTPSLIYRNFFYYFNSKILSNKQRKILMTKYQTSYVFSKFKISKYQKKKKTINFIKEVSSYTQERQTSFIKSKANFQRRMDSAIGDIAPLDTYVEEYKNFLIKLGVNLK